MMSDGRDEHAGRDAAAMPLRPGSREHRRARGERDPHTARPALSRARMVAAALQVLDAEGLAAVSMRRVAAELGTGPASLYAHVGDKQELLDLVLDAVLGGVEVPTPDADRWQEQLKQTARAMRDALAAHNDVALVSLGNVATTPNALALCEGLLGIMAAGEVPPQLAGWFIDRLVQYVDADAYEGAMFAVRFGSDMEAAHQWIADIRAFYHALPASRFPHLAAMVGELTQGDGDERFEFGLSLLVDGLADQARRARDAD
jgi:AcrR family transcriptional regulator